MGKREQVDSHAIINEWRGTWMIPSHVRVVPEPKNG
jgi:hypothetical protein